MLRFLNAAAQCLLPLFFFRGSHVSLRITTHLFDTLGNHTRRGNIKPVCELRGKHLTTKGFAPVLLKRRQSHAGGKQAVLRKGLYAC